MKRGNTMISIYFLSTDTIKSNDFDLLASALPFGESERIRLFAMENSTRKQESLGGLTALYELCKILHLLLPLNVARTTSGKPYFDTPNARAFGISHSRGICAAAIADSSHTEIGLDIEIIDEKYNCEQIVERFFTSEEKLRFELCGKTSDAFFATWTAKEARAKLDGKGLSALICAKESSGDAPVYVSQLTVSIEDKRVAVSVCSYCPDEPIRIYFDPALKIKTTCVAKINGGI